MKAVNSQNISEDQQLLREQRKVSIWEILVKLKTVAGMTALSTCNVCASLSFQANGREIK